MMGASAAWALARRSQSVALLEQYTCGHAHGSSHGDGRIYRTLYGEADYVALMRRALMLWREAEQEAGETLLHECGALTTCRHDQLDRCFFFL